MERKLIFQSNVQRDMDDILRYYTAEAGEVVADRFFGMFLEVVGHALLHPGFYHPVSHHLRRADIPGFPYHFLYRETDSGIRVLVLRHDRRHPSFGHRHRDG